MTARIQTAGGHAARTHVRTTVTRARLERPPPRHRLLRHRLLRQSLRARTSARLALLNTSVPMARYVPGLVGPPPPQIRALHGVLQLHGRAAAPHPARQATAARAEIHAQAPPPAVPASQAAVALVAQTSAVVHVVLALIDVLTASAATRAAAVTTTHAPTATLITAQEPVLAPRIPAPARPAEGSAVMALVVAPAYGALLHAAPQTALLTAAVQTSGPTIRHRAQATATKATVRAAVVLPRQQRAAQAAAAWRRALQQAAVQRQQERAPTPAGPTCSP